MASLRKDIKSSSNLLVRTFKTFGKPLDYSVESLRHIESFLDKELINGQPKKGSFLSSGLGSKIFAIGAYTGEVIIKNSNGSKWETDDKDPQGEINVAITSLNGTTIWPVQRVMKRIMNGKEDDLFVYVKAAVEQHMKYDGEVPAGFDDVKPESKWWKFW
ncbi:hypothetical protein SAMN05421739_105393 [Pontibacter chinhatensis]|uniref:Uncharacterized protein n=2 Tax=Pontibacter chinhatensis TaxID=1436961 RepID=A0A1I2X9P8_9BACT|nr:hypothetical protein SAMN05421739_105393 [Pontibacter chinhatensis]